MSPVSPCGDICLVQGADYFAVDSLALVWTNATDWPNLTGATVTWEFRQFNSRTIAVSFACVVVSATSVQLELSAAQTATIPYSHSQIPDSWELWAVLASGHNVRIAQGSVSVED